MHSHGVCRRQLAIVRFQSRHECDIPLASSMAREMTIHFKSDQRQRCASNNRSTQLKMQIFNRSDVKIAIFTTMSHDHPTNQTNVV